MFPLSGLFKLKKKQKNKTMLMVEKNKTILMVEKNKTILMVEYYTTDMFSGN